MRRWRTAYWRGCWRCRLFRRPSCGDPFDAGFCAGAGDLEADRDPVGESGNVGDDADHPFPGRGQVLQRGRDDVEARFVEGTESFVEEDRLEFRGAGRGEGGDLPAEGERERE